MSSVLFKIVANMLAILIDRVNQDGLLVGVVPHLMDASLSILLYVDDTIFLWNMT